MKHPSKLDGKWYIDFENQRILADTLRREVIAASFGGSLLNPAVLKDAQLIAASPDLLEALQGAYVAFQSIANGIPNTAGYAKKCSQAINEAIHKATGEPS